MKAHVSLHYCCMKLASPASAGASPQQHTFPCLPHSLTLAPCLQTTAYYGGMLAYYWVLATPTIGFLFGCYLYVCVNWFHLHYDEAFSSLRIPHYKGFSRLHITPQGTLHIYSLGIDKVLSIAIAGAIKAIVRMQHACSSTTADSAACVCSLQRDSWQLNGAARLPAAHKAAADRCPRRLADVCPACPCFTLHSIRSAAAPPVSAAFHAPLQ